MSFFDDLFTRKKEPPKKSSGKKPKEDPPTKRLGHTQKKSTHAAAAISKSNFNLNAPPTSKQHQLKPSKSTPDFGKPSTSQIRKHENAGRATAKANLPKPHAAHHLDIATTTSTRSSINHNNNVIVHTEDLDPEILRAISLIDDADVTYRRVHGTNKTSEQSGDDLSRSSSITNLNAEGKSSKGASSKIKKSASKDRLDKIADKKNDKKGLTKNNNKIEDTASYSTESLQEIESLQRQLQEMANDKSSLALQLGEQKGHLHLLEGEMLNLKMLHEQLSQENHLLRSRLKDVAHSPLSDNEKQQLLLESHRHHNSAPASIATNIIEDASTGDVTACPTPDWDKHSSGNVSEISVACLQDRINQMEETHYSTKEELQATVQELNDLQRQLTELQQDNYQLLEEKNLMFDSLCRQTERLNESKGEIESLKQRLRDKEDDTGQYESAIEHEQKLLALLKDTQEEREILLLKHEQVTGELQEAIAQNSQQVSAIEQLNDRIKTLESTLDAKHAEHKQLEREMVTLKDQSSGMQIEINRLSDLLENARTKILELEQDRALSDKSELDELLDNARKEKDALEAEVTNLKEQVARSKNEAEKLKDQVSVLQEECKVTRNNAKCTQSELEYKCDILTADKNALNEQLLQLQEAANGLQVQAQCQMEDKRQLSAVLSETQKLLSEAERRNQDLENELDDLRKLRKDENEEWEKFQNDLLTSVRVANDFKTEAQQDLQKMILENKAHRDKVRHLEAQIDKLRGKPQQDEEELPLPPPPSPPNTLDIPLREQEVQKQEPEAEYHEIIATPTTSEPPQKPDEIDDVELRQSPKSKARSGASPKSFFKKPKIFRNHKGYYVSGPNSLENPDMQGPDSLDSRADLSLPIIPHQVEVPPEKIEEVTPSAATPGTEIKAKKMFGGLMSGKQKKEEAKLHLSSQEQKDLKMLNELYAAIDPNIPEEFLSAEQKFIVKLKQTYESTLERKKAKPVANKPKSHLAISKPLLTSVISNPKLKQIADDPTVRLVEDDTTKNLYNTSNVFYPISQPMSNSKRFEDIHESTITFNYYDNEDTRRTVESFKPPPSDPNLAKSKSLNDLYFRKDDLNKITNFPYDRQHSMGSLTNFVATTSRPSTMNPIVRRPESIASTFSDVSDNSEPNLVGDLAKKRSFYKDENLGETLDELCLQIDPNLSESELTNEQKFVRNMKVSMDEMGRKQSLRKQSKRNAKISEPTKESVWSNPKLASVIKDPNTIEVKPDVPNKENKIRKLLDRFKSKKSEGSPPPPKKVLAKKQISQEDIVHVSLPPAKLEVQKSSAPTTKKGKSSKTLTKHKSETNLIQTKPGGNGGDTLLARHKSETDLAHQHGREDHQIVIDASESTSSLFKSVITNSDLQKLIEGRNVESDRTLHPPPPQKAYENEDNSSFNSDLYVEDTSSLDQPNNLNYSASDSTNSTTSSKKEVIHRISSIPPTESFNTFVKQKISPHTPKTVFDYAELNAEVRTPKPDQEYIEKLLSSNSQQADRDRKSLYIKNAPKFKKQVSTPTRPPPPPPTGPRPKSDLVLEPAQSAVDQNYFNFSFKFEDRAAGTAETAAANYEDVKEEVDSERAVNEEEVAADFSDLNFEFRPTPHNLLPPKNIEEFEVIEPPGMFSNDDVIIPPPPQNDESVQKVEIIEIFSGKIEGLTSPPPPPPLVSFEPDEADIIYSEINYQRFEIMEIIEEISQPMLKELHQDALEVPPPQSLSDQDDQPEIIEVLPEDEAKIDQNLLRKACSDTDFDEIPQFEPQSPQLVTVQDQETDLIEEIDEEVTNSDQNRPKQACSETDFDQINELKPSTLQSSDLDNVQGRESDPIEAIHEEVSNSDQNLPKQACSETDFDQINELKPSTLQSSDLDNVQGRESDPIEAIHEELSNSDQNLTKQACSETDFDQINELKPSTLQSSDLDNVQGRESDSIEAIHEEVSNSDQNLPKQACSETDFDQINELKPSTLQSSDLDNVQGRESDPIEAIHEELSNSDQNLTKQACSETDFDQINELKPSTLQSSDLDNVQGRESDPIEAIHEEVSNSDQNLPKQACSETDFDQINELKPSTLQSSDLDNVQGRESDPIEAMHEEVSNSDQNLSKQACSEPILDEITELPPPPAQSSQLVNVQESDLIEAIQGGDSKIDQNRPEKACSVPNLDEINDLVSVQDQESDLIEAIHEEVQDSDQNLPEKACSGINLNEINELAPPTAQSSQLVSVQNEESDIINAILPHTDQNLPKQTSSDTNFDQINELTPFPQQSSQLVSVQNEESQIIEPIRPKTDQNLPKQSNSDTNLAKISELTPPAPSYYPLVSIQNEELQIIEALQEKVTNSDENVPKHVGSDANFDQINEFPAQSSELVSVQDEESDKIEATQEEVAVSDQNFPEQDRSESNFDEISDLGPPPPTPPQLVDVQNQESDSVEDPKQPTPEHVLKTPQNPPKQALEDTNLDEIPPHNWTNVQNEESDQNPPILDFSQDPKTHLISPDQIPQIIEETVEAKSPKQSEVPTTTSEGFPNIPNVEAPRFDNFPPPPQISQPDPDDDEHIEIRRSSSALKPTDKDADFERDSIHSGTSFSTEIDDTDPNFGSILNPKSRISRQSSVSSEEEIFRRLSYKLDQHELSFFRDVYKKYEVDRAKSPINDTDMAIIERAKLNSLSPDYDEGLTHFENSPNFLDNDVFIEELRRDCQGGDDAADDDDELTPAELELIRRIKSTKEDRPISDINDLDLRIIDTIRQETLSRKSSRCSDLSSTSVRRRSIHTKHDPVEERIKLEEDVKIGKTDDQNLEANRGTDDAPVTKSGADEEKSDEDPARTGAIEREDSKGAEFTHQGVISLEQAKTDDLTADITDSSIRLEESEQEMPEDNKEVELVGTDDGLVRNLVADDEKSRQDQIGMVLIESEDPEILENTNQGEVALEQPKNDYLESLLAATITKKNDKPIKPITPPPKPEPPKHIDDGAGQDLFDFLRKPTAKKLHALKSDVPKETGKKNRGSSFTDALLDEDDDQDIQSRYRISSWVKKTTPKRSSVNESIKARQSAFLQAAQIESKPQAPLKVKAKISHTDDFWKKSEQAAPTQNRTKLGVGREDYGVTRANSVSSDLSKDPNRSRNLYKSNSVGGRSDPIVMTRSKSVEPIWSAFRTEKDNSSETMSERSISPKGYEPIYANYKELQSPRKPVLMKLKKPPVASPRYERKTSKLKVDNAFDKLNMSKEEDDRSSRESTGSLKSTDRDKGVFMDLPVGTPAIKADDQTASGTKPKQGDKVSKTANLLPSKTSSMDILYDSEESAAISEKSSIDKSYLDLFKSPEQAVYENLSETERDATKPPFTTIHFYKSGDISSDSSNVSTTNTQVQDDQQLAGQKSSNTNNKVSFLRKKFEQAKSRNRSQNTDDAIEEVSTEIAEKHPIEKTQSVPANHALKSVPKASNLPLIIGEVGNQSLASANASLENLRKTSRKSFESARSVFELKVKKQDSVSEEQIGADVVANSDNLNSESQIEESNANQNNQTVS